MLSKPSYSHLTSNRRSALTKLLFGWTALIVFPSLYVIAKFLVPPLRKVNNISSMIAAKINEMPRNSAKILKFGTKPVIVVHTETGEYKAFGATCTHLGCIIEYRGERGGYFHCNCHGGEYDLTGKNISGPPPRPLSPYVLSIRDDNVVVTTG